VWRDGTFHGFRRSDHQGGLRSLRGALPGPELQPGQVVVMDNLGAHRPKMVREMIEEVGCASLSLPAAALPGPQNPIEEAFAKLKHILRKIGARGKETLIEAMGEH
jgi:transposase